MPARQNKDTLSCLRHMINLDTVFAPRNAGGVHIPIMRASSREDGETQ
jgi:hypothetical protein